MLTRTLVAARNQMLKATTQLSHQIWVLMAFGLVVKQIILPVLEAWRAMRTRVAELSKQLVTAARVPGLSRLRLLTN